MTDRTESSSLHSSGDDLPSASAETRESAIGQPSATLARTVGPFERGPQIRRCPACGELAAHTRMIRKSTVAYALILSILGCWGPALVVGWLVGTTAGALTAIGLMGMTKKYVLPRVAVRYPWVCGRCDAKQRFDTSESGMEGKTAA